MTIPENYADWRYCVTVSCRLTLDKPFIEQRIKSLQNQQDDYTKSFVQRYGETHYQQVLNWFQQAQAELV